jgi:hypothetical protein
MKARHIAVLVGLSISVFTIFYLLSLLLLTEFVSLPTPKLVTLHVPTVTTQSLVDLQDPEPQASPVPIPTTTSEEGLSVTDPRLVVLDENDVPRALKLTVNFTRYVDNARLIANSTSPKQTQEALRVSGRLNGFQAAFISDDPVASQLRSAGILNFAEIYATPTNARQALQDTNELLAARFPQDGELLFEREVSPAQPVGKDDRAFQGILVTKQDRISVYAILFNRKNTLVGIVLLGDQHEKMIGYCKEYADLIDKRIRNFGEGLAA